MAPNHVGAPSGVPNPDVITEADRAFSRAVKLHRLQLGMTQREISRRLVPPMTTAGYQRIEAGVARSTIGRATQLSEILGVPLEELAQGAADSPGRDRLQLALASAWQRLPSRSRRVVLEVAQALAEVDGEQT